MSILRKIKDIFLPKKEIDRKDFGALIDQSIQEHNQFIKRIEVEGRILRQVDKDGLKTRPYLIWNAFVDTLAMEELKDLNAIQKPPALVFSYEAEVQNGGHFQYFVNRGLSLLEATVGALEELGALQHAKILKNAGVEAKKHGLTPQTTDEFVAGALEGHFDTMDNEYYQCKPDLGQILEKYLKKHQSEFILIK